MSTKVSVLIPVYNVEKYLRQCLDSLVEQTLSPSDLEIICVDDGSTDASPEILRQYAQKYPNLRALFQQNAGSSVARNRALDSATGEYVFFMDSDDWLNDPAALETLYTRATELKLDALRFGAKTHYERDALENDVREDDTHIHGDYPPDLVLSGPQMFLLQIKNNDFPFEPWCKLYRRAFLLENQLYFIEGIVHQDQIFSRQTVALEKREACLNAPYYQYRVREGSVTDLKHKNPYPTIYARLIGSRVLQEFIRQKLDNADPNFVSAFTRNVDGWINLNVKQYLGLSLEMRRKFWRWIPVNPRRRRELHGWMRADIRKMRRRRFMRRLRGLVPRRLKERIKRLLHAS